MGACNRGATDGCGPGPADMGTTKATPFHPLASRTRHVNLLHGSVFVRGRPERTEAHEIAYSPVVCLLAQNRENAKSTSVQCPHGSSKSARTRQWVRHSSVHTLRRFAFVFKGGDTPAPTYPEKTVRCVSESGNDGPRPQYTETTKPTLLHHEEAASKANTRY